MRPFTQTGRIEGRSWFKQVKRRGGKRTCKSKVDPDEMVLVVRDKEGGKQSVGDKDWEVISGDNKGLQTMNHKKGR